MHHVDEHEVVVAEEVAHAHAAHDTAVATAHGGGHDDAHGAHALPHESPWRITAPLVILAACAVFSGYLNAPAPPFETEYFTEWVEPRSLVVSDEQAASALAEIDATGGAAPAAEPGGGDEAAAVEEGAGEAGAGEEAAHGGTGCGFDAPGSGVCFAPALTHAEFKWSKAMPSILLVAFGIIASWWISTGIYGTRRFALKGLTERFAPARWGHAFLVNKYYLDHLYEKVIVHGIAHPIARAAYWTNQHVLDGIVNAVGWGGRRIGEWVYRNVDQRVVDGAVNASGLVASETGHALQPVQSGKINQYGALLFGAAGVGAIVLLILNV
jgi:NADH-quinone oxidoreductase subunit L